MCDDIVKHLHSTGFLEIINWIKLDPLTRANLPVCLIHNINYFPEFRIEQYVI